MVNPWGEESDYLWDYPAGYWQSAAAMARPAAPAPMMMSPLVGVENQLNSLVGGLDMMKVIKTAVLAGALWWAIPKDKNKLLKVGGITAAVYFLY